MNVLERRRLHTLNPNMDYSETILQELANYVLPANMVDLYAPDILAEIRSSIAEFSSLFGRYNTKRIQRILINDDPLVGKRAPKIKADQEIWAQVRKDKPDVDMVVSRIRAMEPGRGRVSAFLALRKMIEKAPEKVREAIDALATDPALADTDLREWARISQQEIKIMNGVDPAEVLRESASDREVVFHKDRVFDTTMPLFFECRAVTKIGLVEIETQISPMWFTEIFGDAMALVNSETFHTNLVLEKQVEGLHPDGSQHFEHFPFTGETTGDGSGAFQHNYWASVKRPFYASGKVEQVTDNQPVYVDQSMSFARFAHTFTHARYDVGGQPMPESVRGVFFGFGHADPMLLVRKAGNLGVGDFQISPRINPHTGEKANTVFFGTFFGKLQGDEDSGQIHMNKRSVHCDKDGRLDYLGDGTMAPDSFRPDDWPS